MKHFIFAIALMCAAVAANAQHSIQIDDGAGNVSIIDGATSGGTQHFQLPTTGGTILSYVGPTLTINGNSLSWPTTAAGYLYNNGSGGLSWAAGGGGSLTGSGTSNYLARWTGGTALGNSVIQDNGTNVGIGITPAVKLAVDGAFALIVDSSVSLTPPSGGDSLTLIVGNRTYYRINSDDLPSDQALGLTAGTTAGQLLILQCITNNTNGFRLIDNSGTKSSGVNLNGNRSLNNNDVITLLWDGDHWEEIAFSQIDKEF